MSFHLTHPFRQRSDAAALPVSQGGHRLLLLLTLGTLLASCLYRVRSTHRHRLGGRSPALPKRLANWENEGGRATDGELASPDTPSPAVPAPAP